MTLIKEKKDLYFIIFFSILLIFSLFKIFFFNQPFIGSEMSSRMFEIGIHELENMYILKPIIDKNLNIINILILNVYFLSITLVGYLSIKTIIKFISSLERKFQENRQLLFISSFVIGSIIFNGFLRIASLNFSITTLNFFIILFLISSIFFFFNALIEDWKKIFNKNFILITLVFFFLLINNLQIDGHHISGDSSYHYGYMNLIKNFLKFDLIPIIGGHYFEPLIITPIIFIIQDFFFFNTFEETTFLSNWFFQAYAKTGSLFLIYYICKCFFEKQKKFMPIIFTLLLFFTNYSGHFFINPLLYDSGNPLSLSIHGSRVIGITSFIFITLFIFRFLTQNKNYIFIFKDKLSIFLIIFFYLIGINSFGIQFILLNLLFISFFLVSSLANYFKIFKNISISFKFFISLFIISTFLSYTFIGRNFLITHYSSYIMAIISILAGFIYYFYSLKININSLNIKITAFSLFFIILSLLFLGNFFTYFFLFANSESNSEILISFNQLFSKFSYVNSKINENGLYNALINYDKSNDFMMMNICSFKDKINLFMTGQPNYHCMTYTRLIYGSGFIFLIFVYNSLKILSLIKPLREFTINPNYKISIYLYFLSTFFYLFSLTYADMLSGSYMLHSRTRFLEVANMLILFNFVMLFSINFEEKDLGKKIIIFLILIKFLLPFSANAKSIKFLHTDTYTAPLYDASRHYYNNWYLNQWWKNLKYLINKI